MTERLTFSDAFAGISFEHSESRKLEVLRGAVLCGNRSLNGYEIPETAFRDTANAKRLYEGVHVYVDHDLEAGISRQVESLAGVVANVRMQGGKPVGDILLGSGSAADTLRNLVTFSKTAEKHGTKLKDVGFSHVARYTFADKDRTVVESVDEVFSVDVVIRPATTKSFKEQSTQPVSEKAPADFLTLLGIDPSRWDEHPIDYAFNERQLFDRSYDRGANLSAVEFLNALDNPHSEPTSTPRHNDRSDFDTAKHLDRVSFA